MKKRYYLLITLIIIFSILGFKVSPNKLQLYSSLESIIKLIIKPLTLLK